MKRLRHDLTLQIVKFLNALLLTVPFGLCWMYYYASRTAEPFYNKGNWVIIGLFCLIYIMFGKIYEGFLISMSRISEVVYSQALASVITDFIMYVVTLLLTKHIPNVLPISLAFIGQIIMSILWAYMAHKWYFSHYPAKSTMIVYDMREGMEDLIQEYGFEKKFSVQETLFIDECLDNLCALDKVETVFLSGIHSHDRNIILKYCIEHDISVYVIPRIGDVIMSGAKKMHMFHLPILRLERYHPSPFYLLIKRLFDVAASGVEIIILSPIMIVVSIAIKLTDGGPIFYKQTRLTKNAKEFDVLKFRSMRVDAEKDGVARLSTGENDDRITPIGRFIRKVRIDELPQLLNILKGDMSIVGPRPERPQIAAEYEQEMPEFHLRLQAKAGLTGYAQVYGKYNTTPYDKLQMDLTYIASPSIFEDLRIMFATIKILFIPESTEGVSEGTTTALQNSQNSLDHHKKF